MSIPETISLIANLVQIVGLPIAAGEIFLQYRSFTKTRVSVLNAVSEWHTWSDDDTKELLRESIAIKCTNAGYFASAVESARFEVQFYDDGGFWNTKHIILADQDTQLSLPLRIDVGETVQLRFDLNKEQCKDTRENKVLFIQKLLRERREVRREVKFEESSIKFLNTVLPS